MAQQLDFPATAGETLTASAFALGTYTGGTAADSVSFQAGTNRYIAAFGTNLAAGNWRLDYYLSGTCIGSKVFRVSGDGKFYPIDETPPVTVADILASGDVDGYTLEQTLKLMLAAMAGEVSGAGTSTVVIRAADDSKPRITATVEAANGNRTALILDATG